MSAVLLAGAHVAISQLHAQTQPVAQVERIPSANPASPIAQGVWVPAGYDTLYLSGTIPPVANAAAPKGSIESYGDTQAQTAAVLARIEQTLTAQKLSMSDVVMMHVYLVGDPTKEGKMDFTGFNAGYSQFFGTKTQPNKPAKHRSGSRAGSARSSRGDRGHRDAAPASIQRCREKIKRQDGCRREQMAAFH